MLPRRSTREEVMRSRIPREISLLVPLFDPSNPGAKYLILTYGIRWEVSVSREDREFHRRALTLEPGEKFECLRYGHALIARVGENEQRRLDVLHVRDRRLSVVCSAPFFGERERIFKERLIERLVDVGKHGLLILIVHRCATDGSAPE